MDEYNRWIFVAVMYLLIGFLVNAKTARIQKASGRKWNSWMGFILIVLWFPFLIFLVMSK
jgi:heme/copper-type cytochrome/quinol oxidase subunit 2